MNKNGDKLDLWVIFNGRRFCSCVRNNIKYISRIALCKKNFNVSFPSLSSAAMKYSPPLHSSIVTTKKIPKINPSNSTSSCWIDNKSPTSYLLHHLEIWHRLQKQKCPHLQSAWRPLRRKHWCFINSTISIKEKGQPIITTEQVVRPRWSRVLHPPTGHIHGHLMQSRKSLTKLISS